MALFKFALSEVLRVWEKITIRVKVRHPPLAALAGLSRVIEQMLRKDGKCVRLTCVERM